MNRAFSSQQYDDSILSNATGQKLSNSVSAHSLNDNADKFIVVIYKYADYEAGFQEDELQKQNASNPVHRHMHNEKQ